MQLQVSGWLELTKYNGRAKDPRLGNGTFETGLILNYIYTSFNTLQS